MIRCVLAACMPLLAATLALSSPASDAYIPPYEAPVEPQLELRSIIDAANFTAIPETQGARFGHLTIYPYLKYSADYTDNSDRQRIDRHEDVILEYSPGLHVRFQPHDLISLALDYEFGWHDYVLDTVKDYLSHRANANLTLNRVGITGLSLSFVDSYIQTSNGSPLENEIQQFAHYETNLAQETNQYAFGHFRISGTTTYAFTHYFDVQNQGGDFSVYGGNLEGSWSGLPGRMEIFGSLGQSRTLFDFVRVNDFDTYTAQAGARGSFSKLTYSMAAGYTTANPLHRTGTTGDLSLTGRLEYHPTTRLSFEMNVFRGFEAGVRTGSALDTNVGFTSGLQLTKKGKLNLSYVHNESDRYDGTTQLSVAYSGRFEYKLQRHAALTFEATRYERRSDTYFDNFKDDEVRAGFRLSW